MNVTYRIESGNKAYGATLQELKWSHTFIDKLPGDSETANSLRQARHCLNAFAKV